MLKLQFKDRRQESIWLVDSLFTIGSSPENSLVINDTLVDSFHAEIHNRQGQATIAATPNGSRVSLNGQSVLKPTPLKAGDIIAVGGVEMAVIDPQSTEYKSSIGLSPTLNHSWQLKSTASWMQNQLFPISDKTILGRDASCDISIPIEHLSRRHVQLEVIAGQLHLKDLNSSNGTFINGKRIQESNAKAGDKIKVDVITFEVIGPASDPNKTIIRSANDFDSQPKKTEKTNTNPRSKKVPVTTSKPAVKKPALASQGKQPWISEGTTNTNKKNSYWWFAIAGFAITVLCVIVVSNL